jgi:hypothetical protein
MKKLKLLKYLPLLFFIFTLNSHASFLDSNSGIKANVPGKISWTYTSNIWLAKGKSLSIYNPDVLSIIDSINPIDKSMSYDNIIITTEMPLNRLYPSFLVHLVFQISIDIFVQSNVAMNDYKNLLTGIDTTLIVDTENIKDGIVN